MRLKAKAGGGGFGTEIKGYQIKRPHLNPPLKGEEEIGKL
jgi:hypothetical protein